MNNARVLVLIPSYNHGPFIETRIQSVLDQNLNKTGAKIDVHLIDDGSNDATMDILASISDHRFTAHQRPLNSGSPFTAWMDACHILDTGDYTHIWIAESDDYASPDFLSGGLDAMENEPRSVLYYTHSWFINERDLIIGHSINYLKKYFPKTNWSARTIFEGQVFISELLLRGMAIPNMSSALIRADAFREAMEPDFVNFRLAADWVFAISVSRLGRILFDPVDANYFRHHERTARHEANHARIVAEHMSATRAAFLKGLCEEADYREQMNVWAGMFRHERVARKDFIEIVHKINHHELGEFLSFIEN